MWINLKWERCDAINCKEQPIKLIEIHAVSSILPEKKYYAQIRVCKSHYDKESIEPTFIRIVKSRGSK